VGILSKIFKVGALGACMDLEEYRPKGVTFIQVRGEASVVGHLEDKLVTAYRSFLSKLNPHVFFINASPMEEAKAALEYERLGRFVAGTYRITIAPEADEIVDTSVGVIIPSSCIYHPKAFKREIMYRIHREVGSILDN
jgi:hypothetical protein